MKTKKLASIAPFFVVGLVLASSVAASAAASGTSDVVSTSASLPWEGPLAALAGGLTGTTAKVISIIAIFIAGIALILGEDLGQFARRLLMIVIAVAFLVGASSFIAPFTAGASIF